MIDRLTDDGAAVAEAARREAERFGHPSVGVCHLLIGVATVGGAGADALRRQGLSVAVLRAGTGSLYAPFDHGPAVPEVVGYTDPAKRALEFALRDALQHGDSRIGAGNILAGLLREGSVCSPALIPDPVAVSFALRNEQDGWLPVDPGDLVECPTCHCAVGRSKQAKHAESHATSEGALAGGVEAA